LSLFGITNYFEKDVAYKALVKVTLMIMAREGKIKEVIVKDEMHYYVE
jgi:hypothetical protein